MKIVPDSSAALSGERSRASSEARQDAQARLEELQRPVARIRLRDGSRFEAIEIHKGPQSVTATGRFYTVLWTGEAQYTGLTRRSWPWRVILEVKERP
jgi:hypothetical protein